MQTRQPGRSRLEARPGRLVDEDAVGTGAGAGAPGRGRGWGRRRGAERARPAPLLGDARRAMGRRWTGCRMRESGAKLSKAQPWRRCAMWRRRRSQMKG
jgi:hypothetical protein